jgi:cephalosporin hydroxylase
MGEDNFLKKISNEWVSATAKSKYTYHFEFEIDKQIDRKLLISVAPDGYLKRVG